MLAPSARCSSSLAATTARPARREPEPSWRRRRCRARGAPAAYSEGGGRRRPGAASRPASCRRVAGWEGRGGAGSALAGARGRAGCLPGNAGSAASTAPPTFRAARAPACRAAIASMSPPSGAAAASSQPGAAQADARPDASVSREATRRRASGLAAATARGPEGQGKGVRRDQRAQAQPAGLAPAHPPASPPRPTHPGSPLAASTSTTAAPKPASDWQAVWWALAPRAAAASSAAASVGRGGVGRGRASEGMWNWARAWCRPLVSKRLARRSLACYGARGGAGGRLCLLSGLGGGLRVLGGGGGGEGQGRLLVLGSACVGGAALWKAHGGDGACGGRRGGGARLLVLRPSGGTSGFGWVPVRGQGRQGRLRHKHHGWSTCLGQGRIAPAPAEEREAGGLGRLQAGRGRWRRRRRRAVTAGRERQRGAAFAACFAALRAPPGGPSDQRRSFCASWLRGLP